jgi:hypothetical protein
MYIVFNFLKIITLNENFNLFYSKIFSYYALPVLITQFVLNVTLKLLKGFFSPLLVPLEMYSMPYEFIFANLPQTYLLYFIC